MKYRSRHDIILCLLDTLAEGPRGKTQLMYAAYLSYEQMNQYMVVLQQKGWITNQKEVEGKPVGDYAITTEGLGFRKQLRAVVDSLGEFSPLQKPDFAR